MDVAYLDFSQALDKTVQPFSRTLQVGDLGREEPDELQEEKV